MKLTRPGVVSPEDRRSDILVADRPHPRRLGLAERLDQPGLVPAVPALDHLAAAVTDPCHAAERDLAAGRREAEAVAPVGPCGAPADDDLVTLGHGPLDGDPKVREGSEE